MGEVEHSLDCSCPLPPVLGVSRHPYSCSQDVKILHLLVFSQQLRVSEIVGSQLIQQGLYVLLHISVSLVVYVWIFEFVVFFYWLYFFSLLCFGPFLFFFYMIKFVLLIPPLVPFLLLHFIKLILNIFLLLQCF